MNGNVWQRDEDQLAEGGSELHSLLLEYPAVLKHDIAGCSTNNSTMADRVKEALKRQ